MTAVEVSVVHDHAGRIISVSQFAGGVRAMVLSGEGKSVFMTTVDHEVVPELIRTHKIDIERGRLVEIPSQVRHRGQEQVAETVPLQSVAVGETKLKQPAHQCFIFGERHHAVANVTRRQHVEIAAQAARTAPVVGYRHHRGDVQYAFPVSRIAFQPAQQRRKPIAPADRHDSQRYVLRRGFHSCY